MKYQLTHRTRYHYEGSVTVSHHLARLAPRSLPGQRCPWHELEILPIPVGRGIHVDSFGNTTTYFEIEGKHEQLEVTARSLVEVFPTTHQPPSSTPPWESVRAACHAERLSPGSDAGAFRFSSPLVPAGPDFAAFARPDFPPGRPVLDGVSSLAARIFRDFLFDPRATDVTTPVSTVLKNRAGVCQDFAHLMIACLRSIGLPARYVSGYLETRPPPGQARLVGADASHAWLSVFCGDHAGWVDIDPTNNLFPGDRHITVAWGRDFSDISPLRGVTLGAGGQRLEISVDVMPLTQIL
jgi:transglutaminase-like putative cysteine protease